MKRDEIEAFFSQDAYAKACGITIDEVEEGKAVCSFTIAPHHLNGRGTVQGGAIFTLADFAFAVAAHAKGYMAVSLENQIAYMHASRGKKLIATAYEVSATKKVCFYQVDVTDDLGKAIARMSVTGYKLEEKA